MKEQREKTKSDLESSERLIKSIGYITLNELTGDAEEDLETIKSVATQYGVDPNMLISEAMRLQNEKVKYPGGDVGSYMFYRDQALEAGITPDKIIDYDSWLTREANRKAKAAAKEKPPTSVQELAAGYAARLEQAEPILNSLEKTIQGMNAVSFEFQIFTDRPSLQSATIQSYMQASRNFINAQLRRESGAVISPSEFSEARKQYLPQPGDTDEVLEQKEDNRRIAFAGLRKSAGPAFESYQELLGQPERVQVGDEVYELQPEGDYKLVE